MSRLHVISGVLLFLAALSVVVFTFVRVAFSQPVSTGTAAYASESAETQTSTTPVSESELSSTSSSSHTPPETDPPSVLIKTGIRGRIVDAKTGEGLIEATIQVVKGKKGTALTDVDGFYALSLSPGTYDLRAFYELYQGRRIEGVIVEPGRVTEVNVQLTADADAVQEVVVEAKADTRKEAALLQERRRAPTVSDAISAQEIARSPDSNAGDAVKRVVSATIVDGKYVLIRGLGGRYVTTLLNGVAVPSPEPDEPAVPLDLFPAALLSNLTVAKSYEAELPGTFGGGALLIETNSYPSSFELKLRVSTSGDSVTTFRDMHGYSGGSLDFFGFDDGGRGLPSDVPIDRPLIVTRDGLDVETVNRVAASFPNVWSSEDGRGYPNLSFGVMVGDTTRLRGKRLGYLGTLSFGHKTFTRRADVAKARVANERVEVREQVESVTGHNSGVLGGLVNVGLHASDNDELNLFSLYTHNGESRTLRISGLNETDSQNIDSTRLQFLSRALSFTQLQGEHRFHDASDLKLRWEGNLSVTTRSEPDTRDSTYNVLPSGTMRFKTGPGSGERFYSDLFDLSTGGSAQASLPISESKILAGASVQRSSRAFEARRFRFDVLDTASPEVLFLPPEQLFSTENIGTAVAFQERTLPTDTYDASLLVVAAHSSVDVPIVDSLRLIGGIRVEHAAQKLEPGSPFAIASVPPEGTDRKDTSLLPSVNAVYSLTPSMNLRSAYSYTLARPQFRELAPFLYFDFARRRSISGNPELVETRIHNVDLRWEWFLGETDLVALSLFHKGFNDPIEQVIVGASQGDVSFKNAAGARALGLELEGRTSLAFMAKWLSNVRAGANLTLVQSNVELAEEQSGPQTNLERPLQGQSPYVVNLNLGYANRESGTELTLLYNVYGRRIAEVGFDTLPDVYEEPFHRFDVSAGQALGEGFQLKLSGTNLLNQAIVLKQGDVSVLNYKPGVAGMVALEWSPQL